MTPASKKAKTVAGASVALFGEAAGAAVQLVTLRLGQMTAKVSTYGATITSVVVPDCRGQPTETTLGFDTHEAYEKCPYYFGATIGRFANRIGQGSFFSIGGTRVQLPQPNDRGNTLHGGMRGWDKAVWTLKHTSATACTLAHSSPDGDAGFPGAVEATVTFSLEWGGRLVITYGASVSAATVLSLTNHAYFNLGATDGGERSDVLDHELMVCAERYLPTDANCLPTGEVKEVSGPMDLRKPVPIHRGVGLADGGGGFDHNYCLSEEAERDASGLLRAAWLRSPRTGIELNVFTTEPGIQVCSADFLEGVDKGRTGLGYGSRAGLCLETQKWPDCVNHPDWPSAEMRPGSPMKSTTIYAFSASVSSTEHGC